MAKDFCLKHNIKRVAFMRLIEEENLVVAEYHRIQTFLGPDCQATIPKVSAALKSYVKALRG